MRTSILLLALLTTQGCQGDASWDFGLRHFGGLIVHKYECSEPTNPEECPLAAEVLRRFKDWQALGPPTWPAPTCSVEAKNLTGYWIQQSGIAGESILEVQESIWGSLTVTFWSSGHVGDHSFERTAIAHGSELRLNGPVTPYIGPVYHQFRAVKVGRELYLVPGPSAEIISAAAKELSCDDIDPSPFAGNVFQRVSPGYESQLWLPPANE